MNDRASSMAANAAVRADRPPVADGTIRGLIARAVEAGRGVEVLLGADVLDDGGFFLPSESRMLLDYAEWLVRRDGKDVAELVTGCFYSWDGEPRAPFAVRLPSLEEAASAAARRLRSTRGHCLRRVDARRIADVLEALAQRSLRKAG